MNMCENIRILNELKKMTPRNFDKGNIRGLINFLWLNYDSQLKIRGLYVLVQVNSLIKNDYY